MGVTVGDRCKGHAPREHKVKEHEDACVHIVRQVVKAAAGEIALGHVAAEDLEQWYSGEEERVEPAEDDHETCLHMGRGTVWVERVHNHVEAVHGDGGQRGDGQGTREGAHKAIRLAAFGENGKVKERKKGVSDYKSS